MNVAVLGCGNMASAIVTQVHKIDNNIRFFTYTPTQTKAEKLANMVSGKMLLNLAELSTISNLDFIIVACKPQQLDELAGELNKYLKKDTHLVSVLAATGLDILQKKLNHLSVSRIMPNTPCGIGNGISLCLHSKEASMSHKKTVEKFFSLCSKIIKVESDEQLDLLTVVSGSGPAYIYEFASGMVNFLKQNGVDLDLSKKLVNQLFVGTSLLMQQSSLEHDQLVDEVTSKAGVTIEAINSYRESNLKDITDKALKRALVRSKQITQELGSK